MQVVINKYGCSLNVKDGLFKIRHDDEIQMLPVSKVHSFVLSRSTKISGEAIALAIANEIDIVFVEKTGKPLARVWSPKFGSIATIRKHQVIFGNSPAAVEWILQVTAEKIDNHSAILWAMYQGNQRIEAYIQQQNEKLAGFRDKILGLKGENVQELAATIRGIEGAASRQFFSAVSYLLPELYRFGNRSQHPASDMFNCLLNYAYGMMYILIEGALIKAGIDPYLGILHRDEYNRPVLVYDVIEKYRIWSEYVVVNLCLQRAIYKEFFDIENGVFWLNAGGKRLLIQAFNDYMEEQVMIDKVNQMRKTHIEAFITKFAQYLKQWKEV
jgi:CRISPR-associated protein Cas1